MDGTTLMTQAVTLSVQHGLATIRMAREHGNAINDALVAGLASCFAEAERDPAVRGVLLAAGGKLFCPGLDLQELLSFERPEMAAFMGRFNNCILRLFTFNKPVVAAIGGHALAGGCVLAMTADRRSLRRGALVGLNEIRVGVPLPWGVALLLRETVHRTRLEEVALLGKNYSDEDAVAAGLVHEVLDQGGFEEKCLERLDEFASKDMRSFAATKRYLRTDTAAKMRASDDLFLGEFLDIWFSPSTRLRIEEIVASLKGRGR